jgi:putative endonuclease
MDRMTPCAVYILTNKARTVLYTGVTSNLPKRLWAHLSKLDPQSFTARYKLNVLAYVEFGTDMRSAIAREKQIKSWRRQWKIDLIERANPNWEDLSDRYLSLGDARGTSADG